MSVNRIAAWISGIIAGIAVVAGLFVVGSPGEQRVLRADRQRVADLQTLAGALSDYWRDNEHLPDRLDELVDGRRLSRVPVDPVSGDRYGYSRTSSDAFELCADFARASADQPPDSFWFHPAGRRCFAFDERRPAERGIPGGDASVAPPRESPGEAGGHILAHAGARVTRTVALQPNPVYVTSPNANLDAIDTHRASRARTNAAPTAW
jgi:hypothetical protein